MNKRNRDIILYFLDCIQYDKSCTLQDLITHFDVSERTIRYDLDTISEFLQTNGLSPVLFKNDGTIYLKDDPKLISDALKQNDFYSFKLSKSERADMISYLLCDSQEYMTLQQLADILFVSRSTIIHDAETARENLNAYNLKIVPMSKGLLIRGKESDRRLLLMRLLCQMTIMYFHQYDEAHLLPAKDQERLHQIIRDAEIKNHMFFTEEAFHDLIEYLTLMIEEQNKGRLVEIDYVIQHISMQNMADDIIHSMVESFGIQYTLAEKYLLSDILYNMNYLKRNDVDEKLMRIQISTKKFIDTLTEDLGINLHSDFIFYQNLVNHLQSTFKDIEMEFESSRSLLNNVMKQYPHVVSAVRRHIGPMEDIVKRPISEDEIAYITIHICAAMERKKNRKSLSVLLVCDSGGSEIQLLISKLRKFFSFYVVEVIPRHALSSYDVSSIELIITTVPVEENRCETILVHPDLSDTECLLLGEKIDNLKRKEKSDQNENFRELQIIIANAIQRSGDDKNEIYKNIIEDINTQYYGVGHNKVVLSNLLYKHIQCNVEANTWQEAIVQSALPLLQEKIITQVYIDQMIRNVEENGPYIVIAPGFALPHESPIGTKKMAMNLIRLKHPVLFHAEGSDPVEFICCLATVDKDTHLKPMFHLMNLLARPLFMEDLKKAKTPEEIYRIFVRYEALL